MLPFTAVISTKDSIHYLPSSPFEFRSLGFPRVRRFADDIEMPQALVFSSLSPNVATGGNLVAGGSGSSGQGGQDGDEEKQSSRKGKEQEDLERNEAPDSNREGVHDPQLESQGADGTWTAEISFNVGFDLCKSGQPNNTALSGYSTDGCTYSYGMVSTDFIVMPLKHYNRGLQSPSITLVMMQFVALNLKISAQPLGV